MERYQSGEKEKPSLFQRLGLKKNNKYDTHLDSGKATDKRNKTKHNAKTEKVFESISKELPQFVVGQEEYLESLTIAFKRAFVVDNQKTYKNMIIILGPDGSGRKYSVKVLAKLLSIEKMIKNSSIYTLDFSDYTEASSLEKLFYPDIYRAFYSDASIVFYVWEQHTNFSRIAYQIANKLHVFCNNCMRF